MRVTGLGRARMPGVVVVLATFATACSGSATPSPSRPGQLDPNGAVGKQTCAALQEVLLALTDTETPVVSSLGTAQTDVDAASTASRRQGATAVAAQLATVSADIGALLEQLHAGQTSGGLAAMTRHLSSDVDAVSLSCQFSN